MAASLGLAPPSAGLAPPAAPSAPASRSARRMISNFSMRSEISLHFDDSAGSGTRRASVSNSCARLDSHRSSNFSSNSNCRLVNVSRSFSCRSGPHRPEGGLQGADAVENNRARFITFLQEQDMAPLNTWFEQPRRHQNTYRELGADWTTEGRSWVMDYWLIDRRWRHGAACSQRHDARR